MQAWLTPLGRRTWQSVRADLAAAEATCVWADLAGQHIAPADETPEHLIATHLWATASGASWRLRVDGADVIGSSLNLSGKQPEHGQPADVQHFAGTARSTPDAGLSQLLERSVALGLLLASTSTGESWFLTTS